VKTLRRHADDLHRSFTLAAGERSMLAAAAPLTGKTTAKKYPDYVCADGLGGAPGTGLEFGAPGAEAPGTFDVQIRMSCSPSL